MSTDLDQRRTKQHKCYKKKQNRHVTDQQTNQS